MATELLRKLHEGFQLQHISSGREKVKKLSLFQICLYIRYILGLKTEEEDEIVGIEGYLL